MTVRNVLEQAIELDSKKSEEYGNSRESIAVIMTIIHPDGILANSAEEYARLTTYMHCLNKIIRYGRNLKRGGHMDSARDLVNYSALLVERTYDKT